LPNPDSIFSRDVAPLPVDNDASGCAWACCSPYRPPPWRRIGLPPPGSRVRGSDSAPQ